MAGILATDWFPLSIHRVKKLVPLGLAPPLVVQSCELYEGSMESSFSTSLAALR